MFWFSPTFVDVPYDKKGGEIRAGPKIRQPTYLKADSCRNQAGVALSLS